MMRAVTTISMILIILHSGGSALAGSAVPPELLAGVPEESVGLFAFQYDELNRSSLYNLLENECLLHEQRLDFEEFIAITGLDPRSDIQASVCVLLGEVSRPGVACLAAGRFTSEQIGEVLSQIPEIRGSQQGPVALWQVDPPGLRDEEDRSYPESGMGMLAMPADGLAVFGDAQSVSKVLATLDGRSPALREGSALLAHRSGQGQIWGTLQVNVLRERILPPEAVAHLPALLSRLDQASFDLEFGRAMGFSVRMTAEDDEKADLMRQTLLGSMAAAKLQAEEDFLLRALLAEIQIARSGRDVQISGALSQELLSRLIERAQGEGCGR